MFKTILAFIKAHTIATAITTTVVVSTAVATPIIINQVHNNQELASEQVQENVINDIETEEVSEENIIETENIIEEEETVIEESSTKQPTPSQEPVSDTDEELDDTERLPAIQQAVNPPPTDTVVKFPGCDLEYNQTLKKVTKFSTGPLVFDRDIWLNKEYPRIKQETLLFMGGARTNDINSGNYPREYCQQEVNNLNTAIKTAKEALEYFKSSGMETSSETFQYGGSWFVQSEEVINARISLLQEERDEWQTRLNSAPTYGPEEARKRSYYNELERAYSYISTH